MLVNLVNSKRGNIIVPLFDAEAMFGYPAIHIPIAVYPNHIG